MPDIIELIRKWWKKMLAVVLLSLLAIGVITFLQPRLYLSIATAVPASSLLSDKSTIFNENIQELYSALGTPDDLDMIVGTSNLDTVYLAVTDMFNLFDHYNVSEKGQEARMKAALILRRNTKVMKSEYGELKVKVWDTDKNLAPQLANAILDKLQSIHQHLQSAGNETTLKGLISGKEKLQQKLDSAGASPEKRSSLQTQLSQYEKMISQYELMIDSKPPSLLTVEKARPSSWPDKPRRLQMLIATAVISLLFALFAALIMESRKTTRQ